uniref:DIRP domain-containing protein n=1 Tax=Aegilops tauschii subsp. strangulata TaxID=200361 RepID=A0A453E5U3_AEGTS
VFCNEGADNLQAKKLLHCLSSESLRRWCTYEWFYSAVDYPWFMNNEFVNYLNFAKLSHLSRLTRSEWSTIRSSLGKPRRFSNHFLAVEKEKLEDYRQNVRKYYAELSDGLRDSLPTDLARPFSVGQHVIVRHPSTRELADGKVVIMERDCYKVQFDSPDLGVDIIKDTDCMPVNWLDNLPDDLKKRSSLSNNAHRKPDFEHIPELTSKESWGNIMNDISVPESSSSRQASSSVGGELLPTKSTTICRSTHCHHSTHFSPPPTVYNQGVAQTTTVVRVMNWILMLLHLSRNRLNKPNRWLVKSCRGKLWKW